MRKWILYGLGVWLLVGLVLPCMAEIKLFLIAGQSNAEGMADNVDLVSPYDQPQTNVLIWADLAATSWEDLAPGFAFTSTNRHGFELSAGKKIYETWGGDVRIIKYARRGTAIKDWMPGKTLYNNLVDVVSAATNSLSGQDYTLEALFWMQGESDAKELDSANTYQTNLTDMIAGLRSQFSAPGMRVVIGRIQDDIPIDPYLYAGTVRTAQVAVATHDVYADWVDTDDLGLQDDDLHYTSAGYIDLGDLMAESYQGLKELPVSTREVAVPEGGTNRFNVRLDVEPVASVTVTVERVAGDTDIQVQSGAALIFTTNNWNLWQTVTLSAAEDADSDNGSAIVHCILSNRQAVVNVTEQDAAYLLPWTETFENTNGMAGQLGALNGQRGWVVSGEGTATVQNVERWSGSQALAITNAMASHAFLNSSTNIWITFWAKPQPVEGSTEGLYSDAAAIFYVSSNHLLVAYDSTNAITLTGTTVSEGWNKFAVSCDYVSKVWNLELNDELVVSNFDFCADPTAFETLQIVEYSSTPSFIDEISVTDAQGAPDTDGDGLPNWWELQFFDGVTNANPSATASNGVNTVLETYIAGLDPTDPDAAFLISDLTAPTSGPVIGWNATSGRVYAIYWTSNLLSGFGDPLTNNLPWTGNSFTDSTHSAEDKGFYKIEVELE